MVREEKIDSTAKGITILQFGNDDRQIESSGTNYYLSYKDVQRFRYPDEEHTIPGCSSLLSNNCIDGFLLALSSEFRHAKESVTILHSSYFQSATGALIRNADTDLIASCFNSRFARNRNEWKTHVIIPIFHQLSNKVDGVGHWSLLYFHDNDVPRLYHYNSLNSLVSEDFALRITLFCKFLGYDFDDLVVQVPRLIQQLNGVDCGVCLGIFAKTLLDSFNPHIPSSQLSLQLELHTSSRNIQSTFNAFRNKSFLIICFKF